MQLEQLVPSLSQCQKLKEIGFPQEGLIANWVEEGNTPEQKQWELSGNCDYNDWMIDNGYLWCAAPTVAELMQYVPFGYQIDNDLLEDKINGDKQIFTCDYDDGSTRWKATPPQNFDTMAEAAAALIIYLHEKQLIKL